MKMSKFDKLNQDRDNIMASLRFDLINNNFVKAKIGRSDCKTIVVGDFSNAGLITASTLRKIADWLDELNEES